MIHSIMTVGGIGTSRWAPGTVASGMTLLVAIGWHAVLPDFGMFLLLTVCVTGLGYGALRLGDPDWIREDPPAIVIDEVAGQCIAFLPLSWWLDQGMISPGPALVLSVVSFGLFRLLDITKPPPISWADGLKGALGIMLDDVLAGLGAAFGLLVLLTLID